MPVSVIAYLILGVISVLIAVALFIKLWNVFIGSNTTQLDINAMGGIIEQMEKDDLEYEQVPFILQIGRNTIFGLDNTEQMISFGRYNGDGSDETVFPKQGEQRPPECTNKPCLCRATGDKIDQCISLSVPDGKELLLAADYTRYWVRLSSKTDPRFTIPSFFRVSSAVSNAPQLGNPTTESSTMLRSLLLNTELTNVLVSTTTDNQANTQRAGYTEETKAIMPIIIEKQVIGNNILITVLPDTQYARSRGFYLQKCPANNDPAACSGKTSQETIGIRTDRNGNQQYCAADILDGSCEYASLLACPNARPITAPCKCGTNVVTYGVCSHDTHYTFECDVIKECADYCKQDGSTRTLGYGESIGRAFGRVVTAVGIGTGSIATISAGMNMASWSEELDHCTTDEINICQGISITGTANRNAPRETVCGLDCNATTIPIRGEDIWVCRPRSGTT